MTELNIILRGIKMTIEGIKEILSNNLYDNYSFLESGVLEVKTPYVTYQIFGHEVMITELSFINKVAPNLYFTPDGKLYEIDNIHIKEVKKIAPHIYLTEGDKIYKIVDNRVEELTEYEELIYRMNYC